MSFFNNCSTNRLVYCRFIETKHRRYRKDKSYTGTTFEDKVSYNYCKKILKEWAII
jgi:hypothetical protein